jgi:hypothetical protein
MDVLLVPSQTTVNIFGQPRAAPNNWQSNSFGRAAAGVNQADPACRWVGKFMAKNWTRVGNEPLACQKIGKHPNKSGHSQTNW